MNKCEEWTFYCGKCGNILHERPVPHDKCASFFECEHCDEENALLVEKYQTLKANISKLLE